jgi:enamine deaminase RidA (YjgF/YER057c/UK114 family)
MKLTVFLAITSLLSLSAAAATPSVEYKAPDGLRKPNNYSHVVVVNQGRLVIVAGQVGTNEKDERPASFADEVKQAFANLKIALAAAGAAPAQVVKLNYYVVGLDADKLKAVREARDAFIDLQHPPASTLVGVAMLFRSDLHIEIEAQAVIP